MVIKPSTMPRLLADAHGNAHNHDLNLRAAYVHVVADAVTSLLAIVALSLGWAFGWGWTDPIAGLAGALVIAFGRSQAPTVSFARRYREFP